MAGRLKVVEVAPAPARGARPPAEETATDLRGPPNGIEMEEDTRALSQEGWWSWVRAMHTSRERRAVRTYASQPVQDDLSVRWAEGTARASDHETPALPPRARRATSR